MKRYVGPIPDDESIGNDISRDVAVSPDSSIVIVTGSSYSSATTLGWVTIAYRASTGAKLWRKRHDGPASDDVPSALDASASAVFVTGSSRDPSSAEFETDYKTIGYALT